MELIWPHLAWDVTKLPALATYEGLPLTDTQWQMRVRDVAPVVSVPWGPSHLYLHDVPVPVASNTGMTLQEAVNAVSVHMRRMVVAPAELENVIAYEHDLGSAAAADRLAEFHRAHARPRPRQLLGSHTHWGGLGRDAEAPHILVLKLV